MLHRLFIVFQKLSKASCRMLQRLGNGLQCLHADVDLHRLQALVRTLAGSLQQPRPHVAWVLNLLIFAVVHPPSPQKLASPQGLPHPCRAPAVLQTAPLCLTVTGKAPAVSPSR